LSTLALVGATATMTNADFASVKIGNRDPGRRKSGSCIPLGERQLARDIDYSNDGGLGLKLTIAAGVTLIIAALF
jgi:hypothetical protein